MAFPFVRHNTRLVGEAQVPLSSSEIASRANDGPFNNSSGVSRQDVLRHASVNYKKYEVRMIAKSLEALEEALSSFDTRPDRRLKHKIPF